MVDGAAGYDAGCDLIGNSRRKLLMDLLDDVASSDFVVLIDICNRHLAILSCVVVTRGNTNYPSNDRLCGGQPLAVVAKGRLWYKSPGAEGGAGACPSPPAGRRSMHRRDACRPAVTPPRDAVTAPSPHDRLQMTAAAASRAV